MFIVLGCRVAVNDHTAGGSIGRGGIEAGSLTNRPLAANSGGLGRSP
jgi:hypothetical protein